MKTYAHYDNISLNSPYNEKSFRTNYVEEIKTHFTVRNFFPKFVTFMG